MYDVTTFLHLHPGGASAILDLAGTDARCVAEKLNRELELTVHL